MPKVSKKSELLSQEASTKFGSDLKLEELALQSNFYLRSSRKITASSLVFGFYQMKNRGVNSLRNWAVEVGSQIETSVSKQAIDNRLNERTMDYLKLVFQQSMSLKLQPHLSKPVDEELQKLMSFFPRILLHDSTSQKIPASLREHFGGPHSQGNPVATLKVQAVYDFIGQTWIYLDVTPYSKNDQSQSSCIINCCQKGDLVLRDLGYFVLDTLEQLLENQWLITKWNNRTGLYQTASTKEKQQVDLLGLLRNKSIVDTNVYVGSKNRIPMRLVARKLPQEQYAKRLESAQKNRHKNANHSATYFELLQWEIYLTNLPQKQFEAAEIAKLYGLRWYIEIFFKAFKSYFHFKRLLAKEKMTYERTMCTIYLILIEAVYLMLDIYHYIEHQVAKNSNKQISILKFFDLIGHFIPFILQIKCLEELKSIVPQFTAHAVYEKRRKRKNMKEKLRNFNELFDKRPLA